MDADEVTYTSTWQDVLAANRLRMRPTRRRRMVWAALALLGIAEITLGLSEPEGRDMLLIGLGLFSCLAYPGWWIVLHHALLPRLSRRYFEQSVVLHAPITVGWSPAGLATRSPHVTSLLPWSAYIGRREDEAVLILLQTDTLYQFIPKRVLDPAQLHGLRAAAGSVPTWPRSSKGSASPEPAATVQQGRSASDIASDPALDHASRPRDPS